MSPSSSHTWVVDGIEEGVARVEEDGGRILTVPAHLLPANAREGQVFSVTRDTSVPGHPTLVVTLDEAATAAALARSAATTAAASKASRKHDPGGDVAL